MLFCLTSIKTYDKLGWLFLQRNIILVILTAVDVWVNLLMACGEGIFFHYMSAWVTFELNYLFVVYFRTLFQ
jgi:hypothetical protein